jgi:hypothetical protein
VITLRWTPGLFRRGSPSGPNPNDLRPTAIGHIVPAPDGSFAADVDFYVCRDRPWWPEEQKARADNACIGPLGNGEGGYLTAVSVRRPLRVKPTPVEARLPTPLSQNDKVRAVGTCVDEDVLFIVEQWTSKRWLQESYEAARAATQDSFAAG